MICFFSQNRFVRLQIPIWIVVIACFAENYSFGQKNTTSIDVTPRISVDPVELSKALSKQKPQAVTETEQLEAEAIEFVKENHPELVSLLQLLKAMRQSEYEAAIRDIVKTKKRLDVILKRDLESHGIELESWKLQSKIDLLLAKGFARNKAFDTKVLRGLLIDQVSNHKKRLKYEQQNILKRQEQVAESLGRLEGHEDERVEQQLVSLMKRVDAKSDKSAKSKSEAKPTKEAKDRP